MRNPYINNETYIETQDLINEVKKEVIQATGQDMIVIKREEDELNSFYGEDVNNHFTTTWTIEMYVESVENFEGNNEFLSKFGFEINDRSTFLVNASRYKEETLNDKPDEGNLVYWPLANKLFEITKVDYDSDFYTLGKNYDWRLSLELFTHNDENMNTGIQKIDGLNDFDFESIIPEEADFSDNVVVEEEDSPDLEINNI